MAQEGTSTALAYTWKIKSFNKLTSNKLHSDVFVLGGYKWVLSAYPKGNRADQYLSLYLEVANSSELPDGWSIDMESLRFTVVNQFHGKDSIEWSTKHRFHAQYLRWDFRKFMRLEVLENLTKGFLVDDILLVEVCFSESAESSSSNVLLKSKNLLAELSSMNRTRRSTSSSGTSASSLPLNPQSLQQHRKALQDYLTLSLEATVEANPFDDIERIAVILVQHSSNSLEKTILEDLVSRLATFKETLVSTKSHIENVKANRIALSEESADVGAQLDQRREQLCTLEANYSELSEEALRLKDEILRLTTKEEELRVRKSSISLELEKLNGQVSEDLGDWRDISEERVEEDKKWLQAREKLAQANVSWNLFLQNLELLTVNTNFSRQKYCAADTSSQSSRHVRTRKKIKKGSKAFWLKIKKTRSRRKKKKKSVQCEEDHTTLIYE